MRRTTLEKRNLQRNTVLEAAAKVFSERGFAGASLGDVAKDLKISRPALYYYFSSKQEILSSLVDAISVASKKAVDEISAKEIDPVTKLHEMTYRQLLFVMRNRLSYLVVVKAEEEFVAETRDLNLAAKKAVLMSFQRVIAEGVEGGHFRKVDPAVAALGLIGMSSWCAWWFKDDGRLSDTVIAEQLTQMALASLLEPENADSTGRMIASVVDALEGAVDVLNTLKKKY